MSRGLEPNETRMLQMTAIGYARVSTTDAVLTWRSSLWVTSDRCIQYPCRSTSVVTPIATLLFGAAK
jgi:hypothetical protein